MTLIDGERITAANVVSKTMETAYVRFASRPSARKAYLTEVAGAVVQRLLAERGDPAALVRALGRGAGERRAPLHPDHQAPVGHPTAVRVTLRSPAGTVLVAVNNSGRQQPTTTWTAGSPTRGPRARSAPPGPPKWR